MMSGASSMALAGPAPAQAKIAAHETPQSRRKIFMIAPDRFLTPAPFAARVLSVEVRVVQAIGERSLGAGELGLAGAPKRRVIKGSRASVTGERR
jgi:hypothetical protein